MRTYYDALGMGKVRNHLIISCRCYEEVCRASIRCAKN